MSRTQFAESAAGYFNDLPENDFESVGCLFGHKYQDVELFKKDSFIVRRCFCGLVWNARQPRQNTLDEFYRKSEAMKKWAELKTKPIEKVRQKEKFERAVSWIIDNKLPSVLDLGCGNGFFLKLIKRRNDAVRLVGTETSEPAVKRAELVTTIFKNTLDEFCQQYSGRKFTLASLWGVLEHLKDPIGAIKLVSNVVNPGGFVMICVPNVDSAAIQVLWQRAYTFCPQHLWYFNVPTLERTVELAIPGARLVSAYTIESEAGAVLKAMRGWDPYLPGPTWIAEESAVKDLSRRLLDSDLGYKIVATFQFPGGS